MTNANLEGVDLTRADLTNANLTNANLTNMYLASLYAVLSGQIELPFRMPSGWRLGRDGRIERTAAAGDAGF